MSQRSRIRLPDGYKAGEVIEVRTLVSHPMETGNRRDEAGNVIVRNIIHSVTARFVAEGGEVEVFSAALNSGISANPFVAFPMRITGQGQLILRWVADDGTVTEDGVEIRPS